MLFDLRGRGRRRIVKVIYASLALLMGGGLVLFGIGGEVSGGLVDAFNEDSRRLGDDQFRKDVAKAHAATVARPKDPKAWATLTRERFQIAGIGENYDQDKRAFTKTGEAKLRLAASAWERYLELKPKPVDQNLARLMVQAYGALDKLDESVRAFEIIVERPDASYQEYVQFASLAYAAGQNRKGDLASAKAIELVKKQDKDNVEIVKGELEQAKAAGAQALAEQAQQSG